MRRPRIAPEAEPDAAADPFSASLRAYFSDPEQEFVFNFSSDGEADLLDVTFDEVVAGGHHMLLADLAWLARQPETEVASDYRDEATVACDVSGLRGDGAQIERIRAVTERAFADLNEKLTNPLILPWPADEHLYLTHGTPEDLFGVLGALAYLSRERGGADRLLAVTREAGTGTEPDLEGVDARLRPVVMAIFSQLDPYGTEWQDDDDALYGRRTGHTRGGFVIDVEADDAATYLADAVAAGRVRAWLADEFARLGIHRSRLDDAFPAG